jgi:hypothetical protein
VNARSYPVLVTLLLSLCFFMPAGHAQSADVKTGVLAGDVADKAENAPIRNAFIYIHPQGNSGDAIPKLDGTGRFRISLAPGLYDIFVASAGFSPKCAVISVVPYRTITFSPRLEPDEAHQEQ